MADLLERAIQIAVEAHRGQVDKAGQPYILHPLRVMFGVASAGERQAAVLHDVVEDTDWTLDRLRREGFAADVVAAVDALTRREGEDYFAFIRRAAGHPLARGIKKADLLDNMDPARIASPSAKDMERMTRYRRALEILEEKRQ